MALGRRGEIQPRPLGGNPQLPLDVLERQRLRACAEAYLAREREDCQAEQILVFDKNAIERRLRPCRKSRRGIDGFVGLGGGVELDDDSLDGVAHVRDPRAEPERANSAALAANRSRRAAMRWLSVPVG